jgi:SAM-dependent methyltransferase
MQWIPVLGQIGDEIVECFHRGGGVSYSSYKRFHEVMAEESYQTVVSGLMEHILPQVPGLTDRLKDGISVLDVGCGRGRAVNMLAKYFPIANSSDMMWPKRRSKTRQLIQEPSIIAIYYLKSKIS